MKEKFDFLLALLKGDLKKEFVARSLLLLSLRLAFIRHPELVEKVIPRVKSLLEREIIFERLNECFLEKPTQGEEARVLTLSELSQDLSEPRQGASDCMYEKNLNAIISELRKEYCWENPLTEINPIPFFSHIPYLLAILSSTVSESQVSEFLVCPQDPSCEESIHCPWGGWLELDIEDMGSSLNAHSSFLRLPKAWIERSSSFSPGEKESPEEAAAEPKLTSKSEQASLESLLSDVPLMESLDAGAPPSRSIFSEPSKVPRNASLSASRGLFHHDSSSFDPGHSSSMESLKKFQRSDTGELTPPRIRARGKEGPFHRNKVKEFIFDYPRIHSLGSCFNPSEALRSPQFEHAQIERALIDQFFSVPGPLREGVLDVVGKCKKNPNTMAEFPQTIELGNNSYWLFCKYNSINNVIELIIFNEPKNLPECFSGRDKTIIPGNYLFLIKPIPLWSYFVGCHGRFPVVRGWNMVCVKDDSKILQNANHKELLQRDGFLPYYLKGNSESWDKDESEEILLYIMPWKGLNLRLFQCPNVDVDSILLATNLEQSMDGSLLPVVRSHAFLSQLFQHMIDFCTKNQFKVYDIKPSNILYDVFTKKFTVIDFQSKATTRGFMTPSASLYTSDFENKYKQAEAQKESQLEDRSQQRPNPVKQTILSRDGRYLFNDIKRCADAVARTIFELLDQDQTALNDFYSNPSNIPSDSVPPCGDPILIGQFQKCFSDAVVYFSTLGVSQNKGAETFCPTEPKHP